VKPKKPKAKPASKTGSTAQAVTIGDKKIVLEGISKEEAEDLKKAAQMIESLGAMFGGAQSSQTQKSAQETQEDDKEFEEMGKELEMFTK
jgi:hypothetical protein